MDQTREFLRRFQVPENAAEKALEYYRLAEMKRSTGLGLLISPTALSLICIKIACVQLGEPFDKVPHLFHSKKGKKQAQRLSGLNQTTFTKVYQTVEKLLSISSHVSLRDLAIKFGCLETERLAGELLQRYKCGVEAKYTAAQKEALDLNKPLYAAAALYSACKLLKIRCDKTKFQATTSSTNTLFQNVLDEMSKSAPKNIDDFKGEKKKKKGPKEVEENEDQAMEHSESQPPQPKRARREALHNRTLSNPFSKEYLAWKENIIREARSKLDMDTS